MKFIDAISNLYAFNRVTNSLINGIADVRVKIDSLLLAHHYWK